MIALVSQQAGIVFSVRRNRLPDGFRYFRALFQWDDFGNRQIPVTNDQLFASSHAMGNELSPLSNSVIFTVPIWP